VHRRLGLKTAGGTKTGIDRHIARLGLDISHFKGQGWSKGAAKRPEEFEETFDRLITEWCGQPAPLQVDHVRRRRDVGRYRRLWRNFGRRAGLS
jgi:hypothetical protein